MRLCLNMVPTAKKKMQNFIHRHETAVAGSNPPVGTSSPRPHAAQLASSPLARREPVDSMKLPLPKSGRYASATQPDPTIPPMNATIHYQPMRRSRTSSDNERDTLRRDRVAPGLEEATMRQDASRLNRANAWEASSVGSPRPQRGELAARWEADSTIGSLFSDSEAVRSLADKTRVYHDRRRGDGVVHRDPLHDRAKAYPDENSPFIISDDGQLKVVARDPNSTNPQRLKAGGRSGTVPGAFTTREDPFREQPPEDLSPKKVRTLSRTKFPLRDGEEAKRRSFAERTTLIPEKGMSASPEPYDSAGDAVDVKKTEATEHELLHKRSTIFQDVEDHITDDASSRSFLSQGDEVGLQHTPRAHRQPEPSRPLPAVPTAKAVAPQRSQKSVAPQTSQKLASPRKTGLQESSLPRDGHGYNSTPKKRRLSLDYDDAALASMSYTDLRNEAFDYDPARVAIRTAKEPSGDSLEDKLTYYKDRDENSQHHFFTEMSVREWEDCGDWFLERFGGIVQQMKNTRQAKRKMVDEYEQEITDREEAVRTRIEGIGRTLADLKQEGEGMMKGKEVEED